MKKIMVLLIILLLCSCLSNNKILNETEAVGYIIENVHIITMKNSVVLSDRAVVIDKGKIIKIIKQSDANKINASQRINGEGRYLMPGLADMHVHVRWNPKKCSVFFWQTV